MFPNVLTYFHGIGPLFFFFGLHFADGLFFCQLQSHKITSGARLNYVICALRVRFEGNLRQTSSALEYVEQLEFISYLGR